MSAVMAAQTTKLDFRATREIPRRLQIELNAYGSLYAYAWSPGSRFKCIASAGDRLDKATFYRNWNPPTLIIGNAHFPVTQDEAADIERVLGPLGLRIERSGPQS